MLDIRFIRENPELVQKKAEQKGYKVDIPKLLAIDEEKLQLQREIEALRAQRNNHAETIKSHGQPTEEQKNEGAQIKAELIRREEAYHIIARQWQERLAEIPNIFPDDTPLGGEEAGREEKKWGDFADKDFEVLDHLSWGEKHELIDFERGAKVAGSKYYFLKGSLVELELAVFQLGIKLAKSHGFIPVAVPHLVNTRILEGAGFSARGEEKQIYKIEEEDLNLIATAEIPLTGYHADEIIEEEKLPLLYAGLSPAYRVEGGAYGKYNRGLYRTHQFNKLELYVYCAPQQSESWHQKLLQIEEELCQSLRIPYRVVRIAAGDLGAPAYKKYDVEYWSPVDQSYRELMSCSNVTDYQSRRLNIRYKTTDGENLYPHTLNATAAAMSRIMIAIIENHQDKDGKVKLPESLDQLLGPRSIL